MTPVECLKKQLDVWISARDHSIKSYQKGTITEAQFNEHQTNLIPKISDYRHAIVTLQKNGFK